MCAGASRMVGPGTLARKLDVIPPWSPRSNVRWFCSNVSIWTSEISNSCRRLLEADRDHPLPLRQPFAGPEEERDAGPAPVVDLDHAGDERLGVRARVDALVLAVAVVLAADDVLGPNRPHRLEDLDLLVHKRLRLERRRRLHRDEAEHLQEVGDDHVAECACRLVEAGALSDG